MGCDELRKRIKTVNYSKETFSGPINTVTGSNCDAQFKLHD